MDILIILAAAPIPLIIGFIWYNPKVFGNAWMEASGLTKEKMEGVNMPLVMGLSFLFAFMLALSLYPMVVHQAGINSIFVKLEDPINQKYLSDFMTTYGGLYRDFGHGAFHGIIAGLFVALPLVGTNAVFERKSFKYIAIHTGYWIVTMSLMGGVICQWA